MRKLRHYLSVFLCVSVLFCVLPAANAAAYEDYTCSAIRYTDDNGNMLTSVVAGTLKASISAKPNNGALGKLVFAMMLYSNNKLIASDCETKTINGETEFNAQVTVPADAENCKAISVLWNSVDEMRAVCAAGVIPGGTNLISGLTVDGSTLEEFNPDIKEYNVTVAKDEINKPVIDAKSFNSAAAIKFIGDKSFPGKTAVEVAAADGSGVSTYTIKYVAAPEPAADACILKPDGDIYGSFEVGKNLNVGDGGELTDLSRTPESGKLGSKVHWDRTQPVNASTGYTNEVRSVADEYKFVLGSDYLMCTAGMTVRAAQGYQTRVRLYRSATLYVFSSEATSASGWDLKQGSNFMTIQNDNPRPMTYVSSKHIEVDDVNAGTDVAIPLETMYSVRNGGKVGGVNITAIIYDGYETIGDNETDTEPTEPDPPEPIEPEEPEEPADAGGLKYTKNGAVYNVIDLTTGKEPTVMHGFKVKTDDTYGSKLFSNRAQPVNPDTGYTNEIVSISSDYDFLLGSDYIMSCLGGWSERADSGLETEFILYKDATVYIFSSEVNLAAAEQNGWTVRSAAGESDVFMWIQCDTRGYMGYVLTKKFTDVDKISGADVVLTKEMLYTPGKRAGVNFTAIDYENHIIPTDNNE